MIGEKIASARNKFNELKPQLVWSGVVSQDAQFLDSGSYSVICSEADSTVIKIFLRSSDADFQAAQRLNMQRELTTYQLLCGKNLGSFSTPILLTDPNSIQETNEVIGSYRMTRITDSKTDLNFLSTEVRPDSPEKVKIRYKDAGALLAAFHQALSAPEILENARNLNYTFDPAILLHPRNFLSDEENQAICDLGSYYDEHACEAYSHLDFHGGNVFFHPALYRITHLIDFGFAGYCSTHMWDFLGFPESAIPHVLAGYESISGKEQNPAMYEMIRCLHEM